MKILIVDDSAFARGLILKELLGLGFGEKEISLADNGIAAIRKINAESYDLLLVDLVMPGIDGVRVVLEIRQCQPHAQIIVCTGPLSPEIRQMLLLMGVHDFLGKPFTREQFRQTIVQNVSSVYATSGR